MKHEPYNEWILGEGPTSERHVTELRQHLAVCDACRRLRDDWRRVRAVIDGSGPIDPPAGFAQRFQIRLAQQRAAGARRQVALGFAVIVAGALGSALLLLDFAAANLVNGLAESLRTLVAARQAALVAADVLSDVANGLPVLPSGLVLPALTVALLGLVAAVYAGLGGLWAAAFYRFVDPNPSGGSK